MKVLLDTNLHSKCNVDIVKKKGHIPCVSIATVFDKTKGEIFLEEKFKQKKLLGAELSCSFENAKYLDTTDLKSENNSIYLAYCFLMLIRFYELKLIGIWELLIFANETPKKDLFLKRHHECLEWCKKEARKLNISSEDLQKITNDLEKAEEQLDKLYDVRKESLKLLSMKGEIITRMLKINSKHIGIKANHPDYQSLYRYTHIVVHHYKVSRKENYKSIKNKKLGDLDWVWNDFIDDIIIPSSDLEKDDLFLTKDIKSMVFKKELRKEYPRKFPKTLSFEEYENMY